MADADAPAPTTRRSASGGYVDLGAWEVYLRARQGRVRCLGCDAIVTNLMPSADGGSAFTRDFEDLVAFFVQQTNQDRHQAGDAGRLADRRATSCAASSLLAKRLIGDNYICRNERASARTWHEGALPSATRTPRDWRTRPDPFAEVWDAEVVPLLEADEKGVLRESPLLELLQERHRGRFVAGQRRTLQRHLRDWRAMHGPTREVYFEQAHQPGREAAVDFTHATELEVTISGVAFVHLLFELVLSFSGWTWVGIAYGETYEALVAGIQGALWALGGATAVLRSDLLSAATHELKKTGGRASARAALPCRP